MSSFSFFTYQDQGNAGRFPPTPRQLSPAPCHCPACQTLDKRHPSEGVQLALLAPLASPFQTQGNLL